MSIWYFLAGPVDEIPPANVGDTGLIPDPGTKILHTVGQLSLCATTTEAQAPQSPCSTIGEATITGNPLTTNSENST